MRQIKRVGVLAMASIAVVVLGILGLAGCSDSWVNSGSDGVVPERYIDEWATDDLFDINDYPTIFIPEGRDVKVMQITDVHYDLHNDRKEQTLEMIDILIDRNAPDVIVLTGDWTSDLKEARESSKVVFDTIDKHNIPWAVVFGNHDSEGNMSKYDYADMLKEYPNSLFQSGPSNIKGCGNYLVQLRREGGDSALIGGLVMMDSHSAVKYGSTKYDVMSKEQIAWYEWAVKGLNGAYISQGNTTADIVPTMTYFHVPIYEVKKAYKKAQYTEDFLIGSVREKEWPPYKNTGLFKAMKRQGSTKAVFFGHDHDNTYAVKYEGIILAYGVETGWCKEYATGGQKGCLTATMSEAGDVRIFHDYYDLASK